MAIDFFLNIDSKKIKGDAKDVNHKEEIQVLSWNWGANNAGSFAIGSGGGAGKVAFQDFHFTMHPSQGTPGLLLHCANGEHFKKAVLTARKSGGKGGSIPYMIITFDNLLVSSYQTGGSGGSDEAVDSISFNFEKCFMKYTVQADTGGKASEHVFGWDIRENKDWQA